MGCDIHPHIEVKINNRWEHLSEPNNDRFYDFFARIAGVRNSKDIRPIAEGRPLPEDLNPLTRMDLNNWDGDAHSHTWFNKEEMKIIHEEFADYFKFYEHKYLDRLDDFPLVQDIRMICFFDN